MPKTFKKVKPIASFNDFKEKVVKISSFTSSTGKRYKVKSIIGNEMFFLRLDAKSDQEWMMNLDEVYRAYRELDDFATVNFKPYVPITHSPARGLLIHLGLLE